MNWLFLTGEWGTGKTHLFCDLTAQRLDSDLPTVLVLAHQLPEKVEPLEALCQDSKPASNPEELLQGLQEAGERKATRSLLLFDGI